MEFWGVEVKPGKPLKVTPEEDTLIHISHANLGDCKNKKGESVPLYVKLGDQKLVLGTLLSESIPQISFDMVFEKEFELSHNWGKGSVYFVGYTSPNMDDHEGGEYFSDSEEEEEEEVPAAITANGNAAKAVAKPEATPAEEDDSDSDDGMDDEDDSDDDEDSEEEEETPKKPELSKKRANAAAPKTLVPAKKSKTADTPQKTEEKKKEGGHTATPNPGKKGGKTPTTATQSPNSAGLSCGSCKKTFNSGNALDSHNKAKHSAAK